MRQIPLIWHGDQVGTIEVADSFRPPITQPQLDAIPTRLFIRSRSWLYDVRHGDVTLQLRDINGCKEVIASACSRMCPGDLGCIIGFQASPDRPDLAADEEMIILADNILRKHIASMVSKSGGATS